MQKLAKKIVFICSITGFFHHQSFSQAPVITLGSNEINLNGYFQISVTAQNEAISELGQFPDIEGFRKVGQSQSNSVNIIGSQINRTQTITQNYQPQKTGKFKCKAFKIKVNGKEIPHQGTTITVLEAPKQQSKTYAYDPFADFFGETDRRPREFVEVNEDAFFSVSVDKTQVYVGEGFNMTIAFYIALNSGRTLEFYNINEQYAEILKQAKPASCWEEKDGLDQVTESYVQINGKHYKQFKLYESTFYPLTPESISIPKIGLKMIKYKVAKNPVFFGSNAIKDFKTYYSEPKKIIVKPLPEHPLKGKVSIGNFQLHEVISEKQVDTGRGVIFGLVIKGEGNISALPEPVIKPSNQLSINLSSTKINTTRSQSGALFGSKTFEYLIEAYEPGTYPLSSAIEWYFFNTKAQRYDTLRPKTELFVSGQSILRNALSAEEKDFYASISTASNTEFYLTIPFWVKATLNMLAIGFVVFIFLLTRKRKQNA